MLSEVLEASSFHFAGRLEAVFALDPVKSGKEMERLVDETVTLVETHMPMVDTAQICRAPRTAPPAMGPDTARANAGN